MSAQPVTRNLLRSLPLPAVDSGCDKNGRGKVLVVGGSHISAGGALLGGMSALRAGAGKVLLAVPESLAHQVGVSFPEAGVTGFATTAAGHPVPQAAAEQLAAHFAEADAALIGPGLMEAASAQQLVALLLPTTTGPAFVIDGMAITGLWNSVPALVPHQGRLVITPHAGEMAHLTGASREQIERDTEGFALRAAAHLGCVVILKGPSTVIAQPDGQLHVYAGDLPGLGTSGSGDVLAGVLTGLLARGADVLTAAVWAVHLHAQAGERLSQSVGPVGFLARELPAQIPALMHSLAL
ncbi:MAG: NAD(P)H-hydrate dehydratase [Steroidobacteraceae bacterium]